jgi:hypothetical protein
MELLKLEDERYVAVDKSAAVVFDLKDATTELANIETDLAAIPDSPDDKTLLAWAKENYPVMDYSARSASLTARKEKLELYISEANKIK